LKDKKKTRERISPIRGRTGVGIEGGEGRLGGKKKKKKKSTKYNVSMKKKKGVPACGHGFLIKKLEKGEAREAGPKQGNSV